MDHVLKLAEIDYLHRLHPQACFRASCVEGSLLHVHVLRRPVAIRHGVIQSLRFRLIALPWFSARHHGEFPAKRQVFLGFGIRFRTLSVMQWSGYTRAGIRQLPVTNQINLPLPEVSNS